MGRATRRFYPGERPDRGKKHTASEQLTQDAMYRIKISDVGKEVVYYTDGSVYPTTRKVGAGIIEIRKQGRSATVTETAVRITDGSSSMQAELVAIAGALTMAALSQTKQVIVHRLPISITSPAATLASRQQGSNHDCPTQNQENRGHGRHSYAPLDTQSCWHSHE